MTKLADLPFSSGGRESGGVIGTWFDHLQERAVAPRFGIHGLLEDRRLRVESASPARGALLRRILEVAGYEVVMSAAATIDGIVTDGGARRPAGPPVIDAAASADASAFLAAISRSMSAKPAAAVAS